MYIFTWCTLIVSMSHSFLLPSSKMFLLHSSPIIFTVDNRPMFEGTFVLATLAEKSDSQISRSQSTSKQTAQTTHTPKTVPRIRSSSQTSINRSQNSTFDNMRSEQSTLRRSDQIGEVSSRLFEKRGWCFIKLLSELIGFVWYIRNDVHDVATVANVSNAVI